MNASNPVQQPAKGKRPSGLSADEPEELAPSRDENAELPEILRKAAAFFAKEHNGRQARSRRRATTPAP